MVICNSKCSINVNQLKVKADAPKISETELIDNICVQKTKLEINIKRVLNYLEACSAKDSILYIVELGRKGLSELGCLGGLG